MRKVRSYLLFIAMSLVLLTLLHNHLADAIFRNLVGVSVVRAVSAKGIAQPESHNNVYSDHSQRASSVMGLAEQTIKWNPSHDRTLWLLGRMYLLFENYQRAVDVLEKVKPELSNDLLFRLDLLNAYDGAQISRKFVEYFEATVPSFEQLHANNTGLMEETRVTRRQEYALAVPFPPETVVVNYLELASDQFEKDEALALDLLERSMHVQCHPFAAYHIKRIHQKQGSRNELLWQREDDCFALPETWRGLRYLADVMPDLAVDEYWNRSKIASMASYMVWVDSTVHEIPGLGATLEELVSIYEEDPEILLALADYYDRHLEEERAEELYQRAFRIDPKPGDSTKPFLDLEDQTNSSFASLEARENLLENGNFEITHQGKPVGWKWAAWVGNDAYSAKNQGMFYGGIDSAGAYMGEFSLRIKGIAIEFDEDKQGARAGFWGQLKGPLKPNTEYIFKLHYKTTGLRNGEARMILSREHFLQNGGWHRLLATGGEWRSAVYCTSTRSAERISEINQEDFLLLVNFGVGDVYFDDVWFVEKSTLGSESEIVCVS